MGALCVFLVPVGLFLVLPAGYAVAGLVCAVRGRVD